MERRFALFIILSFTILVGHLLLMSYLHPPKKAPPKPPPAAGDRQRAKEAPEPQQEPPKPPEPAEPPEQPPDQQPQLPRQQPQLARRWVTLGSGDPNDPYRMLVTLTNKGAAVGRIELSSPRYLDLDDRSGYLGSLVMDETLISKAQKGKGCPVQVVGPGTPAAEAGLKGGDLIVAMAIDKTTRKISNVKQFRAAMRRTKPKGEIQLTVLRGGKKLTKQVVLRRRPLQLIRPEGKDPLSFLLTLQRFGDEELSREEGEDTVDVGGQLEGLDLWDANWEVVKTADAEAAFRRVLPKRGLEITKTYRLATVPRDEINNGNFMAYHLLLDIEIRNVGDRTHEVAYQLDGPTGLPDEGAWYARKSGRTWGAAGLRDVVVSFDHLTPSVVNCPKIAKGDVAPPWQDQSLTFIGVDAQYFSVVMIPEKDNPADIWFARSQPLRVGPVDPKMLNITDISCRMISKPGELKPGDRIEHHFMVFAGPKMPDLLAHYGLGELVYYGWFSWLAKPMVKILHLFYYVVRNYGLAIILLTVLVRGCMFPLSHKQAVGAQKMQQLQPEIKKIQEKYKNDMEGRTKAQQELFRKHNYNPLSGCLVLFIQLPIFIALYRALMVDIELRQAPLISQSVRWCSNLAAPDMLYRWDWMPEFVRSGVGLFGLGPYLNILPIFTIVLFLAQQKMFMPPPTDEQTAMQQKIMKFMMIFMGLIFFKVASGLCIYFIASSLWGLAERQFLPKHTPAKPEKKTESRAEAKAKARQLAAAEAKAKARQLATGRDGAAARKKKTRGKK